MYSLYRPNQTIVIAAGLLFFWSGFAAAQQDELVGVVDGQLSVDQRGVASYRIPLSVPPGLGGLQPALALKYSSNSGAAGLLGSGWSLSGISVIHRCGNTVAQDGFFQGVHLGENDNWCLNGRRLVETESTGSSGTREYRTEIDSYSRITAHGDSSNGPDWFEVEAANGRTMKFGAAEHSRVVTADGKRTVWRLSEVADRNSNYAEYRYAEYRSDLATPDAAPLTRLESISYNDNRNLPTQAAITVEFDYEVMSEYPRGGFSAGQDRRRNDYLRRIVMQSPNGQNYYYQLSYKALPATGDYETSGAAATAEPATAFLASIKQCGTDGRCTKASEFSWGGLSLQLAALAANQSAASGAITAALPGPLHDASGNEVAYLADVNDDGLSDYWVLANSGLQPHVQIKRGQWKLASTVDLAQRMTLPESYADGGAIGDFDGDGLADWTVRDDSSLGEAYGIVTEVEEFSASARDWDGDGIEEVLLSRVLDYTQTVGAYQEVDVGSNLRDATDLVCSLVNDGYEVRLSQHFEQSANYSFLNQIGYFRCRSEGSFILMPIPEIGQKHAEIINCDIESSTELGRCYVEYSVVGAGTHYNYSTSRISLLDPSANPNCDETGCGFDSRGAFSGLTDFNGDAIGDSWIGYHVRFSDGYQITGQRITHQHPHVDDQGSVRLSYSHTYRNFPSLTGATGPLREKFLNRTASARFVDINGDRLTDYVFAIEGEPSRVWLNTGKDWLVAGECEGQVTGLISNDLSREIGSLVDINMDGRADLVTWKNGRAEIRLQNPRKLCDWSQPEVLDTGNAGLVRGDFDGAPKIADIDGDGRPDFLWSWPGQVQVFYNDGVSAHRLRRIALPNGHETTLAYRKRAASYGEKGGARTVVDEYDIAGINHEMAYLRPRFDSERGGFQGFESVTSTNSIGSRIKRWYHLDFPLSGRIETQHSYINDQRVASSSFTYEALPSASGTQILAGEPTVFQLRQLTAVNRRFDPETGVLLSRTTTGSEEFNGFGQARRQRTTTVNPETGEFWRRIVTTDRTPEDLSAWDLPLPEWVREQAVLSTGESAVRTRRHDYYPVTRQLREVQIEPDRPFTPENLVEAFYYDDWGNLSRKEMTGYEPDGTVIRRHTDLVTEFDGTKGVSRLIATNALQHTLTTETDLLFAVPVKAIDENRLESKWQLDGLGRVTVQYSPDNTAVQNRLVWIEADALDYPIAGVSDDELLLKFCTQKLAVPAGVISGGEATAGGESCIYSDYLQRERLQTSVGFNGKAVLRQSSYGAEAGGRYNPRLLASTTIPAFEGYRQAEVSYQYDAFNRQQTITVPAASGELETSTFEYKGLNTITHAQRSVGTVPLTRRFNAIGQLVEITEAGSRVTFEYKPFGETARVTDAAGQVTEMNYDALGRKQSMQSPQSGLWQYQHNSFGELVRQEDAKSQVLRLEYDDLGRLVKRKEAEGTTQWHYDQLPGQSLAEGQSSRSVGRLVEVTAPGGYERYQEYDDLGRLETTTIGHQGQYYDLQTLYDEFSRPKQLTYPGGLTVRNNYNAHGYLRSISTPVSQLDYDQAENYREFRQIFLEMEKLQRQIMALEKRAQRLQIKADYYATRVMIYEERAGAWDERVERVKEIVIMLNERIAYSRERIEVLSERVEVYQAKADDYLEQAQASSAVIYQFIDYMLGAGQYWVLHFLQTGNVQTLAAMANIDLSEHNELQAEALRYQEAADKNQQYLENHEAAIERNEGRIEIYNEKQAYAEAKVQFYEDAAAVWAERAETALAAAEEAIEEARRLKLEYDQKLAELQAAQANPQGDATGGHLYWWNASSINALGQLARARYGNGAFVTRDFDRYSGALRGITTIAPNAGQIQGWQYDYHPGGALASRCSTVDVNNRTDCEQFDYNALDQLETATLVNPWTGEQRSEQWQYSNHGDIEWSSMGGNYDYGQYNGSNASFNRALTHTDEQGELSYDANGNIEAVADAQVAWTSFNKPLQVNEAQAITEKLYGPDRERFVTVERKDGKVTTTISIGGLFEAVSHADGSVEERFHIRAGAEHVAVYSRHQERAGVQYLHAGRQGSVDAVTNERGELVARYHYGPFGERQNAPISDLTDQLIGETEYGYTGHREMAGGSIIDMGGRIYSPALSRFLSPDPYVTEPHRTVNYNRYSYVYNNPLRYTDPSGFGALDKITKPFRDIGNAVGDFLTGINNDIDHGLQTIKHAIDDGYAHANEQVHESGIFDHGYGSTEVSSADEAYGSQIELLNIGYNSSGSFVSGAFVESIRGAYQYTRRARGFIDPNSVALGITTVLNPSDIVLGAPPRPISIPWGAIGAFLGKLAGAVSLAMNPTSTGEDYWKFFHGTDLESGLRLVNGAPLSLEAALALSRDHRTMSGFYMASDPDTAWYFASLAASNRDSGMIVLQILMSESAMRTLEAAGSIQQPVPQLGAPFPLSGSEFIVPPTAFPVFDGLRGEGISISVSPEFLQ